MAQGINTPKGINVKSIKQSDAMCYYACGPVDEAKAYLTAEVSKGNEFQVHLLRALNKCASQDVGGVPPLWYAIMKGPKMLDLFLSFGAKPSQVDSQGLSSVALCILLGDAANEQLRLLLVHGASPWVLPPTVWVPDNQLQKLSNSDLRSAWCTTEACTMLKEKCNLTAKYWLLEDHQDMVRQSLQSSWPLYWIALCILFHVQATGSFQGSQRGSEMSNFLDSLSGKPSVVILDEFEKTSKGVWEAFIQIFDSGYETDHRNEIKSIDCRRTIFVLTTNAFDRTVIDYSSKTDEVYNARGATMEQLDGIMSEFDDLLHTQAKSCFGAAIASRIHKIVPFLPFNEREQAVVVNHMIWQFAADLRKPVVPNKTLMGDIHLDFKREDEEKLCSALAEEFYCNETGARKMKTQITQKLDGNLKEKFLDGQVSPGDQVKLFIPDSQRYPLTDGTTLGLRQIIFSQEAPSQPSEPARLPKISAGWLTAQHSDSIKPFSPKKYLDHLLNPPDCQVFRRLMALHSDSRSNPAKAP
eukprot:gene14731-20775_t